MGKTTPGKGKWVRIGDCKAQSEELKRERDDNRSGRGETKRKEGKLGFTSATSADGRERDASTSVRGALTLPKGAMTERRRSCVGILLSQPFLWTSLLPAGPPPRPPTSERRHYGVTFDVALKYLRRVAAQVGGTCLCARRERDGCCFISLFLFHCLDVLICTWSLIFRPARHFG